MADSTLSALQHSFPGHFRVVGMALVLGDGGLRLDAIQNQLHLSL